MLFILFFYYYFFCGGGTCRGVYFKAVCWSKLPVGSLIYLNYELCVFNCIVHWVFLVTNILDCKLKTI